ncbi:MAG: fatty acid desaturase [Stellaceae bacterium]
MTTVLPFLGSMAVLLYGVERACWFAWLMAIPATLFAVRLFIIQHDCGHISFLRSRRANEAVGLAMSLITLVPFGSWRRAHAIHHATAGNLDQRGTGDITTLTVSEYLSQSAWRKFLYRAYRNPFVLLGFGPLYLLLIQNRIPARALRGDWQSWASVLGTEAAAVAIVVGASLFITPVVFLLAWFSVLYLASVIGIWLFCVQHQFEDTYWERSGRWTYRAAAIEGSSFYDLPRILHWFTGYIGLHHIHHLASRIPNYRLRACWEQNRELLRAKRLTLWGSMKSTRLALWDEERRKLVPFRHVSVPSA